MLTKIDNYIVGKFDKREKMDINQYIVKYNTIWAIIFFLNIEDAFVTLVAVRNSGANEMNPIMNTLLSSPPGFIIAKMVLVCVLFSFVYTYLSRFDKIHNVSCWYIIIFFTLVDINNLVHVMVPYMAAFSG
jgi:hypothetical protein